MTDVEEAQQVVDISLRKIVAWRNNNKKVSGSELHRNLLLASVLLKAHRACSENALAYLDDHATYSSLTVSDDDDDGSSDVTATQDVSSFAATARVIPYVEPVQDSDVVPDQALEEEWEFFGADSEVVVPDGGRTNKEVANIEDTSANVVKDSLSLVDSLSRKRKLEIDESENGFSSRRHRTESTALTCEILCFDLEDLMMSSAEDNCSVQSLDMSSTVTASSLESFGQSTHASGKKNCFDDFDFSAGFLSLRR